MKNKSTWRRDVPLIGHKIGKDIKQNKTEWKRKRKRKREGYEIYHLSYAMEIPHDHTYSCGHSILSLKMTMFQV